MPGDVPRSGRSDLARRILDRRDELSRAVTEEFLLRHPDWIERYGERARRFGIEDARFHVEFLAGALAAGSPEAFARYAGWAARVLARRGIEPRFLAENLDQLGHQLAGGMDGDDAHTVRAFVHEGVRAAQSPLPSEPEGASQPEPEGAPPSEAAEVREIYLQAALRGERTAALGVVREALRAGMPAPDLFLHVLQEAQYEVGRRWCDNRITVAQEHTATLVCQYVLVRLYDDLPRAGVSRGDVVVTGVGGELHQVGANMVADMLEMDGWRVRFLGTDMPHDGIVDAVAELGADVVGISATMLFNVPSVLDLVDRLRSGTLAKPPRILVGGSAFKGDPAMWTSVGADAFANDLKEAVEAARRLVPENGAADGASPGSAPSA